MSEYIKKLRTCIRWLIEREDGNLMEQEKLQRLLESEEKRHVDKGNFSVDIFFPLIIL